jgi:hypothetical protein
MAGVPKPVWTLGPKLAANAAPLAAPLALALALASWWPKEGLSPRVLAAATAFPVAGWASVNFLGLTGNRRIRRAMETRLDRDMPGCPHPRLFVGFARPGYRSALDPHEEVGWLLVHAEGLDLVGDQSRASVAREDVVTVRLGRNPHSWLGLGGWVVIETKPGTWLVEPRERATHLGNRALMVELAAGLAAWAEGGPVPPVLRAPPRGTLPP